jgi:alkylmercury lyase-like protein
MALAEQDWQIRVFIYGFFLENTRPPSSAETAQKFNILVAEAQQVYQRLHNAHHIFLDMQTNEIRMANPLSAIPTDYRVKLNDKWLYANCAWDTLGVAAMVGQDAVIAATLPISRDVVTYHVKSDELLADDNLIVNFALPVRQWYNDLIHT